jgi:hypothetical protein
MSALFLSGKEPMNMHQEELQAVRGSLFMIGEKRWQWMNLLLRILAIELTLIAGLWVWNNQWAPFLFLTVFFGALILRSWWALLVIPAVFAFGIALGIVLLPFIQGGWPALQSLLASGFEGLDFLLYLGIVPVILLTALGAFLGVKVLSTPQKA